MKSPKFKVLRDSSEKQGHGWSYARSAACLGTEVRNLYTADYSVEGLYDEGLLAIERKGAVTEWASCLTDPERWDDFRQELERLEGFRWPFIVLEFTPKDLLAFPRGTAIPASAQRRMRVRGPYLLKRTVEIETSYRSRVVWAGRLGKEYALSIMKRCWEAARAE